MKRHPSCRGSFVDLKIFYCCIKMVDQRGVSPSEDSIGDALKQAVTASGATPLTSMEGESAESCHRNKAQQCQPK